MDWLTQNKLIKWLIGILLVVNIVTITALWLLISKKPPLPQICNAKPPGGIELLQKELNLTDEQAALFERYRKENFEKANALFKDLNETKNLLFEATVKANPDPSVVDNLISKISIILTELEISRFKHFRDLLDVCTEEQKEKFIPVIRELLVGRPLQINPKDGPGFPEGQGIDRNFPPPPPPGEKQKGFPRPR